MKCPFQSESCVTLQSSRLSWLLYQHKIKCLKTALKWTVSPVHATKWTKAEETAAEQRWCEGRALFGSGLSLLKKKYKSQTHTHKIKTIWSGELSSFCYSSHHLPAPTHLVIRLCPLLCRSKTSFFQPSWCNTATAADMTAALFVAVTLIPDQTYFHMQNLQSGLKSSIITAFR